MMESWRQLRWLPAISFVICLIDENSWTRSRMIRAISLRRTNWSWWSRVHSAIVIRWVVARVTMAVWLRRDIVLLLPSVLIIHVFPWFFERIHLCFDLLLTCEEILGLDQVAAGNWAGGLARCWNLMEHVSCWLRYLNPCLVVSLDGRLVVPVHCWLRWLACLLWPPQGTGWASAPALRPLQLISELIHVLFLVLVDNVKDREWLLAVWRLFCFLAASTIAFLSSLWASRWLGPAHVLLPGGSGGASTSALFQVDSCWGWTLSRLVWCQDVGRRVVELARTVQVWGCAFICSSQGRGCCVPGLSVSQVQVSLIAHHLLSVRLAGCREVLLRSTLNHLS